MKKDPGTGLVAAAGAPVVFAVTGATANLTYFDANADGDNNPLTATTDATGKATLEFTKSGAGSVTINASTTVSVGGSSLTRDTDPATPATAGPGGTGPAAKTFVDANIQITPATATNPVGDEPHADRAREREQRHGGFANAPAGTTINFTIVSGPGQLRRRRQQLHDGRDDRVAAR